jgi:hypothetical protein
MGLPSWDWSFFNLSSSSTLLAAQVYTSIWNATPNTIRARLSFIALVWSATIGWRQYDLPFASAYGIESMLSPLAADSAVPRRRRCQGCGEQSGCPTVISQKHQNPSPLLSSLDAQDQRIFDRTRKREERTMKPKFARWTIELVHARRRHPYHNGH